MWLLFAFENNGVEKQTEVRSTAVTLFCQPDSSWRRWCVWGSGGGGWRSRVWDLGSDRRRRGAGRAPCTGASLACTPPAAARWHQRTVTMSHWQDLCYSTKTADYFYCHVFKLKYILLFATNIHNFFKITCNVCVPLYQIHLSLSFKRVLKQPWS